MVDQETMDNNIIIANFYGGKVEWVYEINKVHYFAWKGDVPKQWRKELLKLNVGDAILAEHLQFHSSWEWLMRVVAKILDIINQADKELADAMDKERLLILKLSVLAPLPVVYFEVLNFINWYNKFMDNGNKEFELQYCETCHQMTNHLNGICQKHK